MRESSKHVPALVVQAEHRRRGLMADDLELPTERPRRRRSGRDLRSADAKGSLERKDAPSRRFENELALEIGELRSGVSQSIGPTNVDTANAS